MKFVDECRQWWRLWSVRLAAIAGVIATVLTAEPSILLGLIGMLPHGPWRMLAGAGVGLVVFVIPTLTRLLRQPAKKETPDG